MAALVPTLDPFASLHATTVASWVRNDVELGWLSPETPPPLTAAKVIAWGGAHRRQFLFRSSIALSPIGYGELNDMPGRPEQKWIGHLLLDPAVRGRAWGAACVRGLISHAFNGLGAVEVLLVVIPVNERAIQCYRRAGLTHSGEEWKYFAASNVSCRLLRMSMDRERHERLVFAGLMPGP